MAENHEATTVRGRLKRSHKGTFGRSPKELFIFKVMVPSGPRSLAHKDEAEVTMTQGKRSTEEAIETIKRLLAETDLTIPEIAKRMGRSRANIVAINRKFKIRNYKKRRQHWDVN